MTPAGLFPGNTSSLEGVPSAVLDQLGMAYFTSDVTGAITSRNRTAGLLFGWAEEEASPCVPRWLLPDGEPVPDKELPSIRAIREDRAVTDTELIIERGDASRAFVLAYAAPLRDGELVTGSFTVLVDITQRKHVELEKQRLSDEVRLQAEDLRTVLEVAPIAIAVAHDPQANQISINPAGARMLGITGQENVSKTAPTAERLPFRVLQNGVEVPSEQLPMQRAARENIEIDAQEYEIVRGDGSRLSLLEYATPLHNSEGNVRGALGIFVDLTDRKKADDAHMRLRSLVESSEIAILSAAGDGTIASWNPAAERMFGFTAEEAVGMHISAICPRDRRGEQADVLARVARGERVETFETVRQRKDGSLLDVSLAVSQVRAPDGRLLGVSVLLRDITVRKEAESALRQSEARFRTLTSMSPVGIFLSNPDGDCIMVNERWRDYAGLTVEQARGRGWLSALHPDDRERVRREWYESAQRGGEFTGEYRFRRPDGTVTWLRGIARPLPADDGGVGGYVGTVTDITSLKEAEELKDQFLSLISHELRTPLATIYGSSRLLRDRFEQIADADRIELVEDLVAESERLQRIIENLLLMTRLDAGTVELEPVNLLRLVDHSVSAFQSRHPDRRVNFSVNGEIGPVHGNDMYVDMVVENLLTNAHKYSEHDKPIEVELSAVSGAAELRVKDRGIGIADEDMDRLFAPFFRSRRARAKAAGTGVGLAVCKRVMDAMSGTIWARPRREGGSEFGFRLRTIETGSNDSNSNGDVL